MAVQTSMASSGLAEVLDRILDKGLVIDAWVRVSLLGLEILTIEARVVVAGVPRRRPLVYQAPFGSFGITLRFAVRCAARSAADRRRISSQRSAAWHARAVAR